VTPDSALLEAINLAVIEIGSDGTLDTLLLEWFG
jgi:ABC-type amino acid transport substrate-binding protein